MTLNRAMIIGNLGQNPDLKYTPGGQAFLNLSIATNEKWEDKSGTKQERTEWHKVVVWGKSAENCAKYLKKGSKVFLEGRIQTQEWTDKDGVKRYTKQIVAQRVQFLDKLGEGSSPREEPPVEQSEPVNDDDIPF